MAIITISPKDAIVDFLRAKLTDPRARAETTKVETFDGNATEYSLTPTTGKLSCVTLVTVDGIAKTKWKDYYIDFQNQKVIFLETTAIGTDNVSISYKHGTSNWIYPDKPLDTLSNTSFPRISLMQISGTGERLGQDTAPMESSISIQVDIWAKEDYMATIGGQKYSGDRLNEYIGLKVMQAIREDVDDLYPLFYSVSIPSGLQDLPFDELSESYHKVFNIELFTLNIGEMQDD